MPTRRREWDEDDVRVRPGRSKARRRTKERPAYQDADPAFVVAVDRGRFTVVLGDPHDGGVRAPLYAVKARELGRKGVVVGDLVDVVGETGGETTGDTFARIVRLRERTSVLRRTADDTDPVERVVVANADQLAVVTAVADPAPRTRLVDRCLAAAYDAGIEPLLVVTKADLADPAGLTAAYDGVGVVVCSRHEGRLTGVAGVRDRLAGRVTVLVGPSGVGKSTLVNALVPEADRATGRVNAVTGRGRHTSASAVALPLAPSGWVVDTPGVRSFGLAHVEPDRLLDAFPDLAPGAAECPRGCTHDEADCALDSWVGSGRAGPHGLARLESYRRLLRALRGEEPL